MSRLVHKLRQRVQIQKPVDTPNDNGGYDRTYTTLDTIWMGMKSKRKVMIVRESQVEWLDQGTHEFIARNCAVSKALGTGFSDGFSTGFDSIANLNPLTSELFLFMQRGSTTKGKRFRIKRMDDWEERREYYLIDAEFIEEVGTGANV